MYEPHYAICLGYLNIPHALASGAINIWKPLSPISILWKQSDNDDKTTVSPCTCVRSGGTITNWLYQNHDSCEYHDSQLPHYINLSSRTPQYPNKISRHIKQVQCSTATGS